MRTPREGAFGLPLSRVLGVRSARYACAVLVAITRPTGPELAECELTHIDLVPIDVGLAVRQHAAYVAALGRLGVEVIEVERLPAHPDAVFVEDCAVVVDEVAVMLRPGAVSRTGELDSIAPT